MLIKNNKIIVRRCTEAAYEVLQSRFYEKYLSDGKQLIIPFWTFTDEDVFKDMIDGGLKFYAVALNNDSSSGYKAVCTDELYILNTYNTICRLEDNHFLDDTRFVDTVELIRRLSYQFESKDPCSYQVLTKELDRIVKNPKIDGFGKDLTNLGLTLQHFLADDISFPDKESDDRVVEIIKRLENALHDRDYTTKATDEKFFLKQCIQEFIIEPLIQEYERADVVFWYNTIPEMNSKREDENQ